MGTQKTVPKNEKEKKKIVVVWQLSQVNIKLSNFLQLKKVAKSVQNDSNQ